MSSFGFFLQLPFNNVGFYTSLSEQLTQGLTIHTLAFPAFEKDLKKPGFPYLSIWKNYRNKNSEFYGFTQFKEHLRKAFGLPNPSYHIEQISGEKLQIDYDGNWLQITDRNSDL